ncbi:GDSL-type esterase/lipase family protein [Christensenellaceae bacterium OttesenSCG-928-M15]|nr:GDSL-type esterase/lipase family protein [Christensenellaceae bacterium OttesenSCG-928-M15]
MKRHIVCLGDSNTHGYCADPMDCSDHALLRFNEEERWPCLLQKALGEEYLVIEEGLSGRTTVFPDPLYEGLDALSYIRPCLKSHEPVSLLILMLGTNDTKERFGASAACIALGMERLVQKAKTVDCWANGTPRVLIVAPPPIDEKIEQTALSETMGQGCAQKSQGLAALYAQCAMRTGAGFLDAAGCEFNAIDFMHLTKKGHMELSSRLADRIASQDRA